MPLKNINLAFKFQLERNSKGYTFSVYVLNISPVY